MYYLILGITLDSDKLSYEVKLRDGYDENNVLFLYNGTIICKKSDSAAKKELQLLTEAIPHIKSSRLVNDKATYAHLRHRSRDKKSLSDLFESHFKGIYGGTLFFCKIVDEEKEARKAAEEEAKRALVREKEEAYKESLKPKEIILLEI